MKKRIWELDALRGLCILGMVLVHLVYDLTEMYGIIDWQLPDWFLFIQAWGNLFFLLISGICVTLGRHHIKRGLIVVVAGLLVSAVMYTMVKIEFIAPSNLIYFGILHCLGTCMLLWSLCRKLPTWALGLLGAALVAGGFYLSTVVLVDTYWLLPLGFRPPQFATADYFPLLPYLGWFLLGAVLGRLLYKNKESLLPNVNPRNPIVAVLLFFGKHSLIIYLLHQPILTGVCMLLGG